MIARAIHAGDPILARLNIHQPPPRPGRRPWWRDAPVLRRPFDHVRQLRPCVWVAEDLSTLVMSARDAMAFRDGWVDVGADGIARTYRRCTQAVWADLRQRYPQTPELERLRVVLARVHGPMPDPVARLNAEAAA